MTTLQRQIIKLAKCDVLDFSFTTVSGIEKDLNKRLKKQQKTLNNWRESWGEKTMVESSVKDLTKTLEVVKSIKND
mgnify:CR=1 FL=1